MLIKVNSFSYRLKGGGEAALNLIGMFAIGRYLFAITGITGLYPTVDIYSVISCCIGILLHFVARPYYGYAPFNLKHLEQETDFVPLKRWMVPQAGCELTGHEYQEVMDSFTATTKQKMQKIAKGQGSLTVYDAVNLLLLDLQYSRPAEYHEADEKLKHEAKSKF